MERLLGDHVRKKSNSLCRCFTRVRARYSRSSRNGLKTRASLLQCARLRSTASVVFHVIKTFSFRFACCKTFKDVV